jgi:hypothetical protein
MAGGVAHSSRDESVKVTTRPPDIVKRGFFLKQTASDTSEQYNFQSGHHGWVTQDRNRIVTHRLDVPNWNFKFIIRISIFSHLWYDADIL